ncbi:MAG: hypothetical protein PSV23_16360 [Brevundimonas sp.]|uniref:hypothetical protein n=1 Tax=Brevundimonas sp. TaxID=1871086 RepID=UPI0024897EDA|nr:hypothetical protein [Brevundimonas sp.]MDI1328364.1 hypothetical protein [Brevundimonas sp.]
MATSYEIDIALSSDTITALKTQGFSLYAFKAVQSTIQGGAPLVWFKTNNFLPSTQVVWQEQYQAYISTSQIISGGAVNAQNSIDMNLGDTADVDQYGNLMSASGGTESAISVLNQGPQPWTCGISQLTNGVANPMCAIPLNGNMMDVVAPIERVLLTFATNTVNTGTVQYKCFSSGVLVDLTAAQTRAVSFDINQGWSWGSGTWARSILPNASLVPLLITSDASA